MPLTDEQRQAVKENAHRVAAVVRSTRWRHRNIDEAEALGVASEELCRAAMRFTPGVPSPGHPDPVPFGAFAQQRLEGAMRDLVRRIARRARLQAPPDDWQAGGVPPPPADAAAEAVVLQRLAEPIRQLDPTDQAILEAIYRDQISATACAAGLGVATSTVTRRHHHLLESLRQQLEKKNARDVGFPSTKWAQQGQSAAPRKNLARVGTAATTTPTKEPP